MRFRRSSKLKSIVGSWVSGLSEYDTGAGGGCVCEARNDDVLVANAEGAIVEAIVKP